MINDIRIAFRNLARVPGFAGAFVLVSLMAPLG